MKVRTTKIVKTREGKKQPGHIIDHPDAWRLVKLGVAEEVVEEAAPVAPAVAEASTDTADFGPAEDDD